VDREDLALLVKEGKISRQMEKKAMEEAGELMKRL
jgi:hypothetical protein